MPVFLVLDGVSANSGTEGLEGERIADMYRLFYEIAGDYGERLQLIVVDNERPAELNDKLADSIRSTLSQTDRLIQTTVPQMSQADSKAIGDGNPS